MGEKISPAAIVDLELDPVHRRGELLMRYRRTRRKYAMPHLSEEVFTVTADIGAFNRAFPTFAIRKEDVA